MNHHLDSFAADDDTPVDGPLRAAFWWSVIAAWVFCGGYFFFITS